MDLKIQKKIYVLLWIVCVCILFSACNKSEEAIRVDGLIEDIGEVTLDSESKIVAAEEAAQALEETDYKQLDQVARLEQARVQYNKLLAEEIERERQEEIFKIEEAISKIGTVTLDSKENISNARKLYNTASEDIQAQISNYDSLTIAEDTFSDLSAERVIELISAIGEVSLETECVKRLNAAVAEYNSLNADAKEKVTNSQTLSHAKNMFRKLKNAADEQADMEYAQSVIRVKRLWFSKPDSAGGVELYFNFTNNSEKTIKYVNFGVTFYNAVGDVVTCRIKDDVINYCQETGPYAKGEGLSGSDWYWGKFYSWDISSVKLVYLSIDYMDGSSITLSDKQLEYVQY